MKRPSRTLRATISAAILAFSSAACSGAADSNDSTASGGSAGAAATSGGATVGGALGSGGATSSPGMGGAAPGAGGAGGGAATAGGTAGAATGTGGVVGTAGAGGVVATAGAGGATTLGGAPAVGGATAAGGTAGAATGAGGATTGSGGATGAVVLNQTGNPVYDKLTPYTTWLSKAADAAAKLTEDKTLADNMITWQMPHGGFFKNAKTVYAAPWNGSDARAGWLGANSVELGTIDNGGTTTELMFLADVYRRSSDTKYRDGARKAFDFLLTMQFSSGGFPQVYPARTGTLYSNYVTFNDDAMVRVLVLLDQAVKLKAPLDQDLFTAAQLTRAKTAITSALDYIVKAQIVQGSVKTVWCAQHDPTSYVPRGARSYELASKSGSESVSVVGFLMTQPQTAEIKSSAQAALAWFRSSSVKVANTAYIKRAEGSTDDTYNPIQTQAGSTMWYRFYDLDKDTGFFSGRLPTEDPPGTGKKYDIMEIEAERRYGYQWGGAYGTKLIAYADSVGY